LDTASRSKIMNNRPLLGQKGPNPTAHDKT